MAEECTCSRDTQRGRVVYTCPSCCAKALSMLSRLTAQVEMFIVDTGCSVSALDEDEARSESDLDIIRRSLE